MTKWGGRPHWVYPGRYLGSDELGDWVGFAVGTHFERPGASYDADYPQVTLLPADDAPDRGWVATLHGPESVKTRFYVDITTPVEHVPEDPHLWRAVDLDLDIVQRVTGYTFVDDEDEFVEHQVTYGYPDEVVAAARHSAEFVHRLVLEGAAPFDGATGDRWRSVLASLPALP